MVQLPPGLIALARVLPRLLSAPAVVYASIRIYKAVLGKPAARSLQILAYLLSLPLAFAAKVVYVRINNQRQAALRGAVMAPSIKSNWPAALDKLSTLLWNYRNGYLGKSICTFGPPTWIY